MIAKLPIDHSAEMQLPQGLSFLRRFSIPRKLGICERLFGAKLSTRGVCWVQCANGVLWKLDLSNSSHRWCVYGDYEGPVQMGWLRMWLRQGGQVVDSGANIGQMTLSLAPLAGVVVHAFEPTRAAGDWLIECIDANSWSNVRVLRTGLSAAPGHAQIQLDEARSTLCMDWYQDAKLKVEVVELIRLDDYLIEHGVRRVRLWKLDVEGHELPALEGAADALNHQTIDAILIEVGVSTFDNVQRFLDEHGYGLNFISASGTLRPFTDRVTRTRNLVAIPKGRFVG